MEASPFGPPSGRVGISRARGVDRVETWDAAEEAAKADERSGRPSSWPRTGNEVRPPAKAEKVESHEREIQERGGALKGALPVVLGGKISAKTVMGASRRYRRNSALMF